MYLPWQKAKLLASKGLPCQKNDLSSVNGTLKPYK